MSRKIGLASVLMVAALWATGCSQVDDQQSTSDQSGGVSIQSQSQSNTGGEVSGDQERVDALQKVAEEQQQILDKYPQTTGRNSFEAVSPNRLVYTTAYSDGIDPAVAATEMETSLQQEGVAELTCVNFFAATGIDGPWVIQYDFNDADGSTVSSFEISCE